MNNLKKYNAKRNFSKTKEPKGKRKSSNKKLRFVVQHHLAKKDHYDLRLEYNGVMKSWAVPKGPSYNTEDKRLAIKVENHPISYRTFEGIIPKGEYGGGTVMVWDEGYWEPLKKGKINFDNTIKFTLKGKRLKGSWALIPMKENNYLLIKEQDEFNEFKDITKIKTSIKSGKTMEEIANNLNIEVTNPDKVVFKNPKTTKLDIVTYYEKVSKRMMKYLNKRLISTIRCPDGVKGECFYKKHFETNNKNLGLKEIKNSEGNIEKYYYIKNAKGLVYEAQMNGIEFHIWGSKVTNVERPDLLVFDLDPAPDISLKSLRMGVKDLKSILDELKLESFLKTSGGKGYHVFVPLKTKSWEETRNISKSIASLMVTKWPNKYTTNIRKKNRKGKIFIDWVRNTRSSTIVAPYSVRSKGIASVSMPISWEKLNKIKPDQIKIKDALKLLDSPDPWEDFII